MKLRGTKQEKSFMKKWCAAELTALPLFLLRIMRVFLKLFLEIDADGAVGTDAKPSGLQGDIVKEDDDPGGGDVEIGRKLQNAFAGEIHISLGLQQKNLSAAVEGLTVETLEFQFVNLAAKVFRQHIQAAEACVVAGVGIVLAGVAQAHDEPAFVHFSNHTNAFPGKAHT